MRIARRVLVDRDQAGHAGAARIFRTHGVAGALRRDHQHVEIGTRIDQVKMHVEAVREQQGRALLHVAVQALAIDVALQFVGREHHHDVGPFGGFGDFHGLEARAFGLLDALRTLAQRDHDVLDATVAHIERMSVALAAITNDGDLLALDQVEVGVAIVINAHVRVLKLERPAPGRLHNVDDPAPRAAAGMLLRRLGVRDKPGRRPKGGPNRRARRTGKARNRAEKAANPSV